MKRQYKIKVTPKIMKEFKDAWKLVQHASNQYWGAINQIEDSLKKVTGIDAEIFHCDGELVGIGEVNREMKLVLREDLEE
jgi:hypothetical protein